MMYHENIHAFIGKRFLADATQQQHFYKQHQAKIGKKSSEC